MIELILGWKPLGGLIVTAFAIFCAWLGLKRRDASKVAQGRAEERQKQDAANAAARERMAAVPRPSADETIEIMRRGGM